ncbi:MAG: hypothetical protein HeimC2_14640 [Candidatus Heimdallarchaeota archaeon LC_2]|nr:MAG: hypothetical protein HeimC2_14640 [Candidatus Heimdallarchaeota archaeon LC_2]
MSSETIKEVLSSGTCPKCKSEVVAAEGMKEYYCTKDKSHFHLEIMFHGGLTLTARLNGVEISSDDLQGIEW